MHRTARQGRLGARILRVDGPAKITGKAVYAVEHRPENLVHAVIVPSAIAAGRVTAIDTARLRRPRPACCWC